MTKQSKKILRYATRAHQLRDELNIDRIEPIVGLKSDALSAIEWVTHELAHALTLGFHTFVWDLSTQVNNTMERMSVQTQDSLEIDTSWLTYQALRSLTVATQADRARIASACATALSDEMLSGREYYVLDQFQQRDNNTLLGSIDCKLVAIKHCFQKPLAWVLREYVPAGRTATPEQSYEQPPSP